MKIHELIEARSNPHLNPKGLQGKDAAVAFLKSIPNREIFQYGVSMTDIPKLGINPQSGYNTPIGIYFYPADYFIEHAYHLPFQNDAPYIQILKIKSDKIFDTEEYDKSQFDDDINRLFNIGKYLIRRVPGSGMSIETYYQIIEESVEDASSKAFVKSPAGYFWYVMWRLSDELSNSVFRYKKRENLEAVIWNTMLRFLDYDIVLDQRGIVHSSEKIQGVVLNPSAISHVKMFQTLPLRATDLLSKIGFILSKYKNPVDVLNRTVTLYKKNPKDFVDVYNNILKPIEDQPSIERLGSILLKVIQENPFIIQNTTTDQYALLNLLLDRRELRTAKVAAIILDRLNAIQTGIETKKLQDWNALHAELSRLKEKAPFYWRKSIYKGIATIWDLIEKSQETTNTITK